MMPLHTFVLGAAISLLTVTLCVLVHFEGLTLLDKFCSVERKWFRTPRNRIVLVMMGVLMLHVTEIWIFGAIYALLDLTSTFGSLIPLAGAAVTHRGWFDYVYFSSVVYTTVGFGDIVPTGMYRLLAASESLMGLLAAAWSASFTYLLMQRLWGRP